MRFYIDHQPVYLDNPISTGKHRYSIKAIVVCDHAHRVRAASVGYWGSIHDSMCFQETPINCFPERYFNEQECLLGDSMFKRSRHLMTPAVRSGGLRASERFVNEWLSSALSPIRNVFGLIKQRWRGVDPLKVRPLELQVAFARCAIILHNVCLQFDDDPLRAQTEPFSTSNNPK